MASCPSESDGGSSESNAKTKISTKNQQSQNEPRKKENGQKIMGKTRKQNLQNFWPLNGKGMGGGIELQRCPRGQNEEKGWGRGHVKRGIYWP